MCVKVILNALQTIITFTVILEVLTPYMCILNYNVTQRNKMADTLSILLQGTQVVFRG